MQYVARVLLNDFEVHRSEKYKGWPAKKENAARKQQDGEQVQVKWRVDRLQRQTWQC